MIKYSLKKNPLAKEDEENYVAMVSSLTTRTLDDVVIKMVEEGTGLTRPQAMAYFEKLTQTIINFLQDGYSVNTPFFRVRPSISGVFAKYNDLFDPNKHQLNFRLNAGTRLQPVLANISIEKDKSRIPVLDTFFDGMSRQINTVITPGGNAEIKGECLNFNPEDLKQGGVPSILFFYKVREKTQVLTEPVDRNLLAESKVAHCEMGSEGS